MELDTLSMDRNAARAAFLEYRNAFRIGQEQLDGELMRGYRALAAGQQVIRLSSTIQRGGVDTEGRPRLAVARADEPMTTFTRTGTGAVTFSPNPHRRVSSTRRFVLPPGTLPTSPRAEDAWWWADQPFVPPRFRPPHGLSNYALLWEAVWRRGRSRAAVDPALLKPIGGDLYAVLAVWDLTPLEAAVLDLR